MTSASHPHTLVITNDYPPRAGGIQTFVYEMVKRFDEKNVTVVTSSFPNAEAFDSQHPWRVIRSPRSVLLPTRATRKIVLQTLQETGATRVVFGAAAPLGLLGRWIRNQGVDTVIAMTHGHEVGWAITPGMRSALRRIVAHSTWVTYLGQYTASRIQDAVPEKDHYKFRQLTPGVDPTVFSPNNLTQARILRSALGLEERPVVICISRLMARKGQDMLIRALSGIQQSVPGTALVIVGTGPYEKNLRKLATQMGVADDVYFTGRVSQEELPAWYCVGDVFAMPCRTRNAGWDVEGLGIVFLEASASGLPVIAGNSGGAPDAVIDNDTGHVVDGGSVEELTDSIVALLTDEHRRTSMAHRGRNWVEGNWTWDYSFARLADLLAGIDPDLASRNKL